MVEADARSTEALAQELFERIVKPSAWAYSVLRTDAAATREREHLSARLAASKEVKQEKLTGAGRLVGTSFQPQRRDRPGPPASATVYAIVQPTKAASLNCSYSATGGGGFTEAYVSAETATSGESGMDAELRLRRGGAWEAEGSIWQLLPSLPVKLSHAVHGKHSPAAGPAQHSSHVLLQHTTSLAVPLPLTAAELAAGVVVPSALSLERPHIKLAALPGPPLADEDGAAAAAQPPTTTAASAPIPAFLGTHHHHHRHLRKMTLKVQPRQGGHRLDSPATHAPTSGTALERHDHQQEEQRQQKQKQRRTYVPQLTAEVPLPPQEEGGLRALAPQDAVLSWRQAWGPCLSSTLKWRHVQIAKPKASIDSDSNSDGCGSSSALASECAGSSAPPSLSEANLTPAPGSPGHSNMGGLSDGGRSQGGSPTASPRQHSADNSTHSLGAAAAVPAVGEGSGCEAGGGEGVVGAGPATVPRLQCELGCSLGRALKASAKADLDVDALGISFPGRGTGMSRLGSWAFPPPPAALRSAVKSASARVKYKLGGGGRRALSLQSSYSKSGLCHALIWQQGRKGDVAGLPWEMEQQGRLRLNLSYQTAGQRASFSFDFFLPLG